MTPSNLESESGAQQPSVTTTLPEAVERPVVEPSPTTRRINPMGTIGPALTMSAACLAAVVIGSLLHKRNVWGGLNAMAPVQRERRSFGWPFRRQPGVRTTFEPNRVLTSLGTIGGGSLLLSLVQQGMGPKLGNNRLARGAVAAATALVLDRVLGAHTFWPTMKQALGAEGLTMTYGALGTAGALAPRTIRRVRRLHRGGELAPNVSTT